MSSPLTRRPIQQPSPSPNIYEKLGLSDNPFPSEPSLSPDSQDPRRNGLIYCEQLHDDKKKSFTNLLIPEHGQPRRITFLMDHASRRGRGIGKSAFLKHQERQIMADLGDAVTRGAQVLFALHVIPPAQPPCRKFSEFCRLIYDAMVEKRVITKCICRLRALTGVIPPEVLDHAGPAEKWSETIGSNQWLKTMGVDSWQLRDKVDELLMEADVDPDLARALSAYGSTAVDHAKALHRLMRAADWRLRGAKFLFNDIVKVFRAAQFTHGFLLIDELEKIVIYQNIGERRHFAESLRYCMQDGPFANNKYGFYQMTLTIHPGIQELLLSHWKTAGLDRLAPLAEPEAQQSTIYFGPLDEHQATPLVVEYLNHYRLDTSKAGSLEPFDRDAVIEALVKSNGVPGHALNLLYRVVEYAAREGLSAIAKETVSQVVNAPEREEAPEVQDMSQLPRAEVRLSE